MKRVKELPKEDENLSRQLEKEGWKKIKEPKNVLLATICALPIVFILLYLSNLLAYILKPSLFDFINPDYSFKITVEVNLKTLIFIIGIFVYVFIHEMIHAVMIPNFRKSEKTVWGIKRTFWICCYHRTNKKI